MPPPPIARAFAKAKRVSEWHAEKPRRRLTTAGPVRVSPRWTAPRLLGRAPVPMMSVGAMWTIQGASIARARVLHRAAIAPGARFGAAASRPAASARDERQPLTQLGGFGGGVGSGGVGKGGGGGGDGRRDGDGDDGAMRIPKWGWAACGAGLSAAFLVPGTARAHGSIANRAEPRGSDMMTCFLYGFSWFYGVKLFLKHLFSPCALFLGSMWLLTRMGVLPERLGPEAYEAYVKPWIPKEWTDAKLEVSGDAVKTCERKFWASVHRALPATAHPTCEKVFFAGILLAGLV